MARICGGGAADQREDEQRESGRAAAQVEGVQYRHGDGAGHGSGDCGAGQDQQRDGAGTALVGPVTRLGGKQALQRRAGARGLRPGQHQRQQQRDRSREETGGHVRAEGGLVLGEPVHAEAEGLADQGRAQQRGRRDRERREGRTQVQPPQRVQVVRERPYGRALRRRRRQQGGSGAVLGQRPQPLGGAA